MFSLLELNYTLRNNYIFTASFRRDGFQSLKKKTDMGFPSLHLHTESFGADSSFKSEQDGDKSETMELDLMEHFQIMALTLTQFMGSSMVQPYL